MILELHTWVAFVFDTITGGEIMVKTAKTKKELEDWWDENSPWFIETARIRYTMASYRESIER